MTRHDSRRPSPHRGDVGGIRHKFTIDDWKATGNRVPARNAGFADPGGNNRVIQEIGCHLQDTAVASKANGCPAYERAICTG